MIVKRSQFPPIISENEEGYIKYLEAVVNSHDLHSSTEITFKPTGYLVRIAPSDPIYLAPLLESIKNSHRMLGIDLEFSKSIKTGNTITYNINNN